jgi:hypothetical protein
VSGLCCARAARPSTSSSSSTRTMASQVIHRLRREFEKGLHLQRATVGKPSRNSSIEWPPLMRIGSS